MFKPDEKLLKKYADVLVKFALNSGEGVKPQQTVIVYVPDVAKPLLKALQRSILETGAYPMLRMIPTGLTRDSYDLSGDDQLEYFPKKYYKALIDTIDHQIGIIAETDLKELEGVDTAKIIKSLDSRKKAREWQEDKEYQGKFTWTIALYPTKAMADEAGMSIEEYWKEIVKACYLDLDNPIQKWREILKEQERVKGVLDKLQIEELHVEGKSVDLRIKLGGMRKWLGGSGRNIPSFEVFISPDFRGTKGWIEFDQPFYMYGNKIQNIRLEFKNGKVTKATASRGEKLLLDMIKRENADKVGEFSLTDKRASRITKFMATTLFDENIGGRYGNMHIALGLAYKESYTGDIAKMKKSDWKKIGFNQSPEHKDIINTRKKKVTATLKNGKKKVIYEDGMFRV